MLSTRENSFGWIALFIPDLCFPILSINVLVIVPAHSVKVPHDYFTMSRSCYRLLLTEDSRGFLFYLSFIYEKHSNNRKVFYQ